MNGSFSALSLCVFLTSLAWAEVSPGSADRHPSEQGVEAPRLPFSAFDSEATTLYLRGIDTKSRRQRVAAGDTPERIAVLLDAKRLDEALDEMIRAAGVTPQQIHAVLARAADKWHDFFRDGSRDYRPKLRVLAKRVRTAVAGLPREDAARTARQLLIFERALNEDGVYRTPGLARFIERYHGTEEALLAEVTRLDEISFESGENGALLDFAKRHSGSVAAAKALYQVGFRLHANPLDHGERPGSDPTNRFLRVLDIVRELESGRYPRCQWVTKARDLAINFFAYEPKYTAANIQRLVEAYIQFAVPRLDGDLRQGEMSYFLTSKLAEILRQEGDVVPAMERVFEQLAEAGAPEPAVSYLRVDFYLTPTNGAAVGVGSLERAVEALVALRVSGGSQYQNYALSTLAGLHFSVHDYSKARDHYEDYLRLYGDGPFAWVAAIRVGQALQIMGRLEEAAGAYLRAAERYSSVPLARVLGLVFAARVHESRGEFQAALGEYRASLAAWDEDFGLRYELRPIVQWQSGKPQIDGRAYVVHKTGVRERADQLTRSLTIDGGSELERGRWLLRQGRYDEAAAAFTILQAEHRGSLLDLEARTLTHEARLGAALALANIESVRFDEPGALQQLDALAAEPHDAFVAAARIAAAVIVWKRGDSDAANARMEAALKDWMASQDAARRQPFASELERDVTGIRSALFEPSGLPLLKKNGWNAFSWPPSPPRFLVVNPTVGVVSPGQGPKQLAVLQRIGTFDNVLFVSREQLGLLGRIVATLGGTERREPRAIMEPPNQPIGPSLNVLEFINRFFPSRPGHWGGWEFETYPVISNIEFLNKEHTRAAAAVTVGYSGATVILVKKNGKWVGVEVVNFWVT